MNLTYPSAGGSAYYFAKRSINEERLAKFQAQGEKARHNAMLEQQHHESSAGAAAARYDHSGSPSSEANIDPAPTRHAPETDAQRIREKSKFEASEPYSARKGDRFS